MRRTALDRSSLSDSAVGMIVFVHYHALLRDKTGRTNESFDLPGSQPTLRDLLNAFFARYPGLRKLETSIRAAVHDEFVEPGDALNEGDRVDLLPPFGGG